MNDALRLADLLEDEVGVVEPLSVATELRRLDAENQQLKAHIELQDDDIAMLLEQRKELLELVEDVLSVLVSATGYISENTSTGKEIASVIDAARAAIAKATGEKE